MKNNFVLYIFSLICMYSVNISFYFLSLFSSPFSIPMILLTSINLHPPIIPLVLIILDDLCTAHIVIVHLVVIPSLASPLAAISRFPMMLPFCPCFSFRAAPPVEISNFPLLPFALLILFALVSLFFIPLLATTMSLIKCSLLSLYIWCSHILLLYVQLNLQSSFHCSVLSPFTYMFSKISINF